MASLEQVIDLHSFHLAADRLLDLPAVYPPGAAELPPEALSKRDDADLAFLQTF